MMHTLVYDTKPNKDHLLGKFLDENHYHTVVTENTQAYLKPLFGEPSEKDCLFHFIKGAFTAEEQKKAYEALADAATLTTNRGVSSGDTDMDSAYRLWFTSSQEALLDAAEDTTIRLDGEDPLELELKSNRENVTSVRGRVWKIPLFDDLAQPLLGEESTADWLKRTAPGTIIRSNPRIPMIDSILRKWLTEEILPIKNGEKRKKMVKEFKKKYVSDTVYANPVRSGVAGYLGRYSRIPFARTTSYTRDNLEKFSGCYEYMEKLESYFKEFFPHRWSLQKEAVGKISPEFLIGDTVFSTLTINKNFRTAAHHDAGDFEAGFSNLSVVSKDGNPDGSYTGGYLVLPEYDVAVNLRPGDLLLVNNHAIIHANTPIVPVTEGVEPERISIVAYLRDDLIGITDAKYEKAREEYCSEREGLDKFKVTAEWDKGQDFRDWLTKHYPNNVNNWIGKVEVSDDLGSFFG